MKTFIKTAALTLIILLAAAAAAFAEQDIRPKDLTFTPEGGGKYIYSNNPEFITRDLLADYSNPNPTFLMTNEDMGKDKYAMFISHVNHTKILKDASTIKEKGFEVELDVLFSAKEDTEITFTALGFEVPENKYYFSNGMRHTFEEPWGCLNAWSDYLGVPIRQIESGKKYTPKHTGEKTVTIKKGENFWISEIIENYRTVPFFRPVHMLADFEIKSGLCDINIAALKSTGTLRDRSNFNPKSSFAKYEKDRQYKGIADSLNIVSANLEYTIDASVYNNTKLPVTVHNQTAPEKGNYTQTWVTHINPKANITETFHVAESDMLKFTYRDDNKLKLYGKSVPEDEKDNIWRFDTLHSDSDAYPGKTSGYSKSDYIPNYEIPKETTDYTTCNLGNYGVKTRYNLKIKNDGWKTRYLDYGLICESNIIVMLYDKDGEPLLPYALCKGATAAVETDTVLSIPILAQQTSEFTIEVILPTNYNGAIMNTLTVMNSETDVMVYEPSIDIYSKNRRFTGQEYIAWEGRDLYTSKDLETWEKRDITEQTKKIFDGCRDEFEFIKTDSGYMAKPTLYDGRSYYLAEDFYTTVYFLDNGFNLKSSYKFGSYPTYMSYANGIYYVYAGSPYQSSDGTNWYLVGTNDPFPVDNLTGAPMKMTGKTANVLLGGKYVPLKTEGFFVPYIDLIGQSYFFINGGKIRTSPDGVYWKSDDLSEPAETIDALNGEIIINGNQKISAPEKTSAPIIIADGSALGFRIPPEISTDGVSMVPLRFLAESLGKDVSWDDEESLVTVDGIKIIPWSSVIGSTDAVTNVYYKDGQLMVPLRALCEELGADVSFDGENNIITINSTNL